MANTNELGDEERQAMGLKLLIVVLVGIAVAFLWVGRYQIVSTSGPAGHLRLDRWTGTVYTCAAKCFALGSPWRDMQTNKRP
jgi:hypothetical protein